MANLKDISTVPELETLEGTEKVLLNVDGSARQVAVNAVQADWTVEDENSPAFIKNKPVEEWDIDITVNITFDTESGNMTRVASLNTGSFTAVKNKILNNEQVKAKVHNIFTSPEDASIVSHENVVIYCNTYAPEGTPFPFEAVILLGHSFIEDMIMMYVITSDNTIEVMEY